jgi:cytoskeletal protein CcmA (bactofilin family)
MSLFNKKSPQAPAVNAAEDASQGTEASSLAVSERTDSLPAQSLDVSSTEAQVEDSNRSGALGPKPTLKPSILSNGFEFEGVIKSDGVLNISSSLRGKVFAKSIFLDIDGVVEGEIQAEVLTVKGKIYGEIHCQDLTVGSRAVIDGSCFYRTLNIQRGGRISGKLSRTE